MNGAERLVRTLVAGGIDVCFTNPGTSEMHFVAALDKVPGMRCCLALFEGVATGAADGYWRMKDRPASTLLHLGPGLANGLANLHNARKASSGIVNIVGEHASWHLKYDAPLTSDIAGLAAPMSHWVRTAASADAVAQDGADAIAAARTPPGRIATLILPGDTAWDAASESRLPDVAPPPKRRKADRDRIEAAARLLKSGEPTLLILANSALRADALEFAGRIAARTGCRIASQFFSSRIERGAGRVAIERIPYAVAPALEMLKGFRHLVTLETNEPVSFFGYPGKPSLQKAEGTDVLVMGEAGVDSLEALEALADAVGAKPGDAPHQQLDNGMIPTGALDPVSIARILCALVPEHGIVVDESVTTGREAMVLTASAQPHDCLQNMGGSIGFGGPVATGAAIAAPHRKVICLTGDGSAMYTIQSLWTQARESLDVTTIVFANRAYQILKGEFAGVGAGAPGKRALDMLEIDRPTLDFVALAKGMGVPGRRVVDCAQFTKALSDAMAEAGPKLIEVVL